MLPGDLSASGLVGSLGGREGGEGGRSWRRGIDQEIRTRRQTRGPDVMAALGLGIIWL